MLLWLLCLCLMILILIVLLPLEQIFPRPMLRRLLLMLREVDSVGKNKKDNWKHHFVYLCEILAKWLKIRISPESNKKYKESLILAGISDLVTVESLVGMKILVAATAGVFYLIMFLTSQSLNILVLGFLMAWISYMAPDMVVKSKIKRRQWQLQVELPSILNTLAILTGAGLSFFEAIKKVTEYREGVLAKELKKVMDEVNMGIMHRDALLRMSERCQVNEVSVFVLTLVQTIEKGAAGVTLVLREQSKELWEKRKNRARELGEQASIKLFMPMMLLVFPCLLLFLMGPAIITLFQLTGQ